MKIKSLSECLIQIRIFSPEQVKAIPMCQFYSFLLQKFILTQYPKYAKIES